VSSPRVQKPRVSSPITALLSSPAIVVDSTRPLEIIDPTLLVFWALSERASERLRVKTGFAASVFFESAGETPRRAGRSFYRVLLPHNTRCISTGASPPSPAPRPAVRQLHCRRRRCIERNFTASRSEMFVLTRPSSHNAATFSLPFACLTFVSRQNDIFIPSHVFCVSSHAFRLCPRLYREERVLHTPIMGKKNVGSSNKGVR